MEWYNGFSPAERTANGVALNAGLAAETVPRPSGNCALCGDPAASLEYHSEDYARPYRWTVPAAYAVCRHCHRNKLHKRFAAPEIWEAFKAHVRRGGYASDLKDPLVKREVDHYRSAGMPVVLKALRPYNGSIGKEWWEKLTMDPASRTAPWARPNRSPPKSETNASYVSNRELILRVGTEGGDITLYGIRAENGWRFQRNVVDQTPRMLEEQEILHASDLVATWEEALVLLDRYPWTRLSPREVHPEFRHAVWAAVEKRYAGDSPEADLDRWHERCEIGT